MITNDCLEVPSLDVIKFVHLFDGVGLHLGRHVLELFSSRSAQNGNLFNELAAFRLAWEDGPSGQELGKDAANSPNIDGSGVIGAGQDEFWRTIIAGNDVGSIEAVG